MNRGELEALVAQYIHREDLGDQIPGFIDLATNRIGRDLRSAENQTVLEPFSPATQVSDLPEDFRNMRDVTYLLGSARVVLRSASPKTMSGVPQTGNRPIYYRLVGKQIEIVPFQVKEMRLVYFNAPAPLTDSASENAILTNYEQLYLYASLIEAYFFTQDAGGHGLATETYTSEIDAENNRSKKADAGDRPSIT